MRRKLGYAVCACGLALLAYAAIVIWRGDPITGYLAHREQRVLAHELRARPAAAPRRVPEGTAFGWISIPRIGLRAVVVEGTSTGDLEKGPGHYRITALPGLGDTVAIAGHRTTWGAWFRHLDDLHKGDPIVLRLPYGTVSYRVTGERSVLPNDWSVLRDRGYHRLILSTCDPPGSASHRLIVFARESRFRKALGTASASGRREPAQALDGKHDRAG
jgi:LPXTG-site transpeptidase (sortase) family protein